MAAELEPVYAVTEQEFKQKCYLRINDKTQYLMDVCDSFGITYSVHTNTKGVNVKLSCPFHGDDANPSLSYCEDGPNDMFNCFTCGAKSTHMYVSMNGKARIVGYPLVDLLAEALKGEMTEKEIWDFIGEQTNVHRPKREETNMQVRMSDATDTFRTNMENVLSDDTLQAYEFVVNKRGLDRVTINQFELGYDYGADAITIPIRDEVGSLVNIRVHRRLAPDVGAKVSPFEANVPVPNAIYGLEHVYNDSVEEIVVCEGELDRIIAEKNGFAAMTNTSGGKNFIIAIKDHMDQLKGKKIYLAYDNDKAGREFASNVYNMFKIANIEVFIVKWPSEFVEKGDITDYFVGVPGQWEGRTAEDFRELLEEAALRSEEEDETYTYVDLDEGFNANLYNTDASKKRRIRLDAIIYSIDTSTKRVPSRVNYRCSCEPDERSEPKCIKCPFAKQDELIHLVTARQDIVANCINKPAQHVKKVLREHFSEARLGPNCKHVTMFVEEYRQAFFAMIGSDKPTITNPTEIIMLDSSMGANESCTLYGFVQVSTKGTNTEVFVCEKATPGVNSSANFVLSNSDIDNLKAVLNPSEDQTIQDKLDEIYEDISVNVSQVYGRNDLLFGTDLTYHSVLGFCDAHQVEAVKEGRVKPERGWLQMLAYGESDSAKTKAVLSLRDYYELGDLVDASTTGRTGLLFSIESTETGRYIMPGRLVTSDRGLVIIEEFANIHQEEVAQLRFARSSGYVEVNKSRKATLPARTRQIYVSNPRTSKDDSIADEASINKYAYGIQGLKHIFGTDQDLRRTDFVVSAIAADVTSEMIDEGENKYLNGLVPNKITKELRRKSVLWAWSREPHQVPITVETRRAAKEVARQLAAKFTPTKYLVSKGDQQTKVLRMACALACALFSTEDGITVNVLPEHVYYIGEYLDKLYCAPGLRYDKYTESISSTFVVDNKEDLESACESFKNALSGLNIFNTTPFIRGLGALRMKTNFSPTDIMYTCMVDSMAMSAVLSEMQLKYSIVTAAGPNSYRFTDRGHQIVELLNSRLTSEKAMFEDTRLGFDDDSEF